MATKTFKIGLSNTDKQNMAQDVYERLLALTFPEYDSAESYEVGDFVVYNDQLYKCIGATTGAWDSTKWQLATLNDLLTDIEDAVQFVNDKANVDGNYPTMTVGLAGNLDTKIVDNDVNAYLFRPTGGLDTESGNNCKEKAIVGGSLGFNQLLNKDNYDPTRTLNGITWTNNGDGSITVNGQLTEGESSSSTYLSYATKDIPLIKGHIYYIAIIDTPLSGLEMRGYKSSGTSAYTNFGTKTAIVNFNGDSGDWRPYYVVTTRATTFNNVKLIPQFIDLTAMFGSTIADYIYSLETGTAGAGVAWFKRYFNKPYYLYTPIGGFTHVQTRGKKAVGFNLWDEETELGGINSENGNDLDSQTDRIRSKNYIPVLPSTSYYLKSGVPASRFYYDSEKNFISANTGSANIAHTTPSNCYFMRIILVETSYTQKACLNFHYDGERDGEYEPHREEIYENDPVELIGIPQKDDQGNLYFDGNRYLPSGVVEENAFLSMKVSDMSLNRQELGEGSGIYFFLWSYHATLNTGNTQIITPSQNSELGKFAFPSLTPVARNVINVNDLSSCLQPDGQMLFRDESCTTVEAFKQKYGNMKILLFYKTPTTSSAIPYPETQWVDNWGTEERLPPLSDTRPCEIPVGHDTDYPLDLKSKLEIMPNSPSQDGDYVLHAESGVNTYVALGSWLSTNGYIKLTDIGGYDATKTQTLKNVEGTLTWVDD